MSTSPNSLDGSATPNDVVSDNAFIPLDGTLRAPNFSLTLTQPASLDVKVVPPFRITHYSAARVSEEEETVKFQNEEDDKILINISRQFTQKSLNRFLYPCESIYLKIRIYSIYENQKGSINVPMQEILEINNIALLTKFSNSAFVAYGQKSETVSLKHVSDTFHVYAEIYKWLERYWVSAPSGMTPHTPSYESKFGGGLLSRRSGAPSIKPKFVIRALTANLFESSDVWLQRGATVVDTSNGGEITNIRFTRMEMRDALLDAFIANIEIIDIKGVRERGIARLNNQVVLIENSETLNDLNLIELGGKPPNVFNPPPLPLPPPRNKP